MNIILLIIGFVILVKSADLLVDSASALAKRLNIPNIVIGLTIVAFGTSAPELSVNILSSLDKANSIALGNIVGSNIVNILLILGISSIIYPLTVKTNTTWIEIPLCFLASIVVMILSNDIFIDKASASLLSRIDGLILLLFFIIFLVYNIHVMLQNNTDENIEVKNYTIKTSIIYIIISLILLISSGKLIVSQAVNIAQKFGISERIIGLTIVAIGTSLPELATSVIAAKKRNVDLAIGNIVGSNIFNTFFILGISAIIYPIRILSEVNLDFFVNIIASILLFVFIFTGKGRKLERWEGIIFLLIYSVYTGYLIIK